MAVGGCGNLSDYLAWSMSTPGQEGMYFGGVVAMLWAWLLCLGLFVAGLVSWGVRSRGQGRAEVAAAPDGL